MNPQPKCRRMPTTWFTWEGEAWLRFVLALKVDLRPRSVACLLERTRTLELDNGEVKEGTHLWFAFRSKEVR